MINNQTPSRQKSDLLLIHPQIPRISKTSVISIENKFLLYIFVTNRETDTNSSQEMKEKTRIKYEKILKFISELFKKDSFRVLFNALFIIH